MRLGIFMGSFDPVHMGHMSVIATVLREKLVDHIHVVPAFCNPWKSTITSYEIRVAMCMLATEPFKKKVDVRRYERLLAEKLGVSSVKSYLTLRHIRDKNPNTNLYLIVTTETLKDIPKWAHGDEILASYNFIVVSTHHTISKEDKEFIDKYATSTVTCPRIEISSTMLRKMALEGCTNLYPYVPASVAKTIKLNKLYEKLRN